MKKILGMCGCESRCATQTGQECSHLAAQSCEGHHGPGPSLFWHSRCLVSKEALEHRKKKHCKNTLSKQFLQRVWLVIICPGFVFLSSVESRILRSCQSCADIVVANPADGCDPSGKLIHSQSFSTFKLRHCRHSVLSRRFAQSSSSLYLHPIVFFLAWPLGQLQMFVKKANHNNLWSLGWLLSLSIVTCALICHALDYVVLQLE